MKPITRDFQEALKGVKEIDAIISYADKENTNFIVTQNSELLQTEAEDFLVTESAEAVIENHGIQNCSIYWNTDVLRSVCKMLDLETSNEIPKGTEVFVKIGVLVGEEYEYVDYGRFITTEDSKKQLDTGTYLTTAYDVMVKFHINVSKNPLTFQEGVAYTLKQYLEMICNKCGVPYSLGNLSYNTNATLNLIEGDPYEGNRDVTYRDILDDITECLGTNLIINSEGKLTNKDFATTFTQEDLGRVNNILLHIITPTEEDYRKYDINRDGTIDISDRTAIQRIINNQDPPYISVLAIDDKNLKDHNVNVGEKKEGIDGIQVYDGSAILNYVGEENSVFIVKNNRIMNAYSEQLLSYLLSKISGLSYYAYELNTFGILALEPFDFYYLDNTSNNTRYMLCSFHNEINATAGLGEDISYAFKDQDGLYEYALTSDEDRERNAYIELDKANGQIVLKATADGNLVQVELDADASEGSTFNVKADNINFEGKTFDLTSEEIEIQSNNFSVDTSGNLSCSNANITGGRINLESSESDPRIVMTGSGTYGAATHKLYYAGLQVDTNNFTPFKLITTHYNYGNSGLLSLYNEPGNVSRINARQWSMSDTNDNTTILLSANSGNIQCVSLTQTSLEENKENIEKYDGALKEIMNTDIYKYNLKGEKDTSKKHLGFVIGKDRKYSKEIVALDEDGKEVGVDNYSMTSLCLQAIKEQQEQIEKLQKEIKSLKGDDK